MIRKAAFGSIQGEGGVERISISVSTCTFTNEGAFDFIDGVDVLMICILPCDSINGDAFEALREIDFRTERKRVPKDPREPLD